jgi:hypothetical protein
MDEKWSVQFCYTLQLPSECLVLLHAANLRHGTDGFTSPPKEGMLRFYRHKNPMALAVLEPAILCTRGQHAYCWTNEAAIKGI